MTSRLPRRSRRWLANVAVWAFALHGGAGVAGCTRVAAYERGRLAHPSMRADLGAGAGRAHLYAIREGARGGRLGAGSGCGCN